MSIYLIDNDTILDCIEDISHYIKLMMNYILDISSIFIYPPNLLQRAKLTYDNNSLIFIKTDAAIMFLGWPKRHSLIIEQDYKHYICKYENILRILLNYWDFTENKDIIIELYNRYTEITNYFGIILNSIKHDNNSLVYLAYKIKTIDDLKKLPVIKTGLLMYDKIFNLLTSFNKYIEQVKITKTAYLDKDYHSDTEDSIDQDY